MSSIKDLQEQLITEADFDAYKKESLDSNTIIVFKYYKFHKQLSIELHAASVTGQGKIKNPLHFINPLNAALKATKPDEIKFFAAVSRFQNNPTAAKSAADIEALKAVLNNPSGFRVFYHNPDFSTLR